VPQAIAESEATDNHSDPMKPLREINHVEAAVSSASSAVSVGLRTSTAPAASELSLSGAVDTGLSFGCPPAEKETVHDERNTLF
jgi:hypothetical protein